MRQAKLRQILQALIFDRGLVLQLAVGFQVHGSIYTRLIGANVCNCLWSSSSMQGTHHEHSRARRNYYPSSKPSKNTRLEYPRVT